MPTLGFLPGKSKRIAPLDITTGARRLYEELLEAADSERAGSRSRAFLTEQLALASHMPCELPADPQALHQWTRAAAAQVAHDYADYLASRQAGEARRFFGNRAHALSFIQRVAPTKLVDGAWLHGVLPHWQDERLHPLIRTYLEELGDGDPAQNHVLLYRKLMNTHGCEIPAELDDAHYLQGALQLALGRHADEFLPEVIGYNLGYEQLPLHLLISAFELNELDIDPYYFTLHVTIDNTGSGHAHKAVQTVLQVMASAGDPQAFYRRVQAGYQLNELGLGSTALIDAFDLQGELIAMLERKRQFGQQLHSDFCRIGGRTVNQWLARPGQIPAFLQALEERGWIRRHADPSNSRFWQLVQGPGAAMFGVFSPYEQQLLHDWIAGDWLDRGANSAQAAFRPRPRRTPQQHTAPRPPSLPGDSDLTRLSQETDMRQLIAFMTPASHPSPAGLLATRRFSQLLR